MGRSYSSDTAFILLLFVASKSTVDRLNGGRVDHVSWCTTGVHGHTQIKHDNPTIHNLLFLGHMCDVVGQ